MSAAEKFENKATFLLENSALCGEQLENHLSVFVVVIVHI